MSIQKLLDEEIESEINELKLVEKGSQEHTALVNNIVKLCDKSIDMDKTENELCKLADETRLQYDRLDHEKNQDLWKNSISIAGIVVPTLVSIWGIVKSIKFEETGTFTTSVGRGLISKIIPKR